MVSNEVEANQDKSLDENQQFCNGFNAWLRDRIGTNLRQMADNRKISLFGVYVFVTDAPFFILRSKPKRIVLMLSKKFYENKYCNIEYIEEKNFDINELKTIDSEFKDTINKMFSDISDLVAVECDT